MKLFLLFATCIVTNIAFSQRRSDMLCASDTGKIKIESGLYRLITLATKTDGLRAPKTDKYYCIEKANKLTLNNIDSMNVVIDKFSKEYVLNFHFNKTGTQELAKFSTTNMSQEVGFFINNKLISATQIFPIESGNMSFGGGYSEAELIALKNEILKAIHK